MAINQPHSLGMGGIETIHNWRLRHWAFHLKGGKIVHLLGIKGSNT
jgi:hypothetical protein